MKDTRYYAGILLNILVPAVQIALVCLVVPKILVFFLPFVIGWVIAMIANPLVRMLERRLKLVRKHSSALIVVAVLAAVIGLGYFLVSRLFMQAYELVLDIPELYALISAELKEISVRLEDLLNLLPDGVQREWEKLAGDVGQAVGLLVQNIAPPTVEAAGSVAMRIPSALVNIVVTILSSYFFIAERDRIIGFWEKNASQSFNRYYGYLRDDVKHLIGGYFLAQFKIMFVVGLMLFVGFAVLGVKYSGLLAILVSMLDFLPVFGTGTVLIPWALFKVLGGQYALAAGLALLYVLTQVVRQLIQPKIVGDSMGLPPLWTLIFLFLGFKLHGISGMILAVPLGIIVMNLYKYGAFDSLIANIQLLGREIRELRDVGSSSEKEKKDGCDRP